MELYDLDVSGNCYKVRLFASLANIALRTVPVDFMAGEHKRAPLSELNAWGELPILVDGACILRDSQAILVYLASAYGGEDWWPKNPCAQGEIMQWLSTAANEIQNGPNAARLIDKFNYPLNKASSLTVTNRILPLINEHLSTRDWLATDKPSIADCAIFPNVALAYEGGVDVSQYANIQRWSDRIKALPGYIPMPGI